MKKNKKNLSKFSKERKFKDDDLQKSNDILKKNKGSKKNARKNKDKKEKIHPKIIQKNDKMIDLRNEESPIFNNAKRDDNLILICPFEYPGLFLYQLYYEKYLENLKLRRENMLLHERFQRKYQDRLM